MTDSVSKTGAMEPPDSPHSGDAAEAVDDAVEGVTQPAAPAAEDLPEGGSSSAAPEVDEHEAAEGEPSGARETVSREELEVLNDRYLRLAAEFTNYRRRSEQERAGVWGRAQGELVEKLLDVLDDLQRVAALDLGNATVEAIMEGIDLVDRKFGRVLTEAGVEVLDPAGERFDPQTMEAMMRVPAESEEDDDRVAMVFQKGYALKGQLLRPARVGVRKLG